MYILKGVLSYISTYTDIQAKIQKIQCNTCLYVYVYTYTLSYKYQYMYIYIHIYVYMYKYKFAYNTRTQDFIDTIDQHRSELQVVKVSFNVLERYLGWSSQGKLFGVRSSQMMDAGVIELLLSILHAEYTGADVVLSDKSFSSIGKCGFSLLGRLAKNDEICLRMIDAKAVGIISSLMEDDTALDNFGEVLLEVMLSLCKNESGATQFVESENGIERIVNVYERVCKVYAYVYAWNTLAIVGKKHQKYRAKMVELGVIKHIVRNLNKVRIL